MLQVKSRKKRTKIKERKTKIEIEDWPAVIFKQEGTAYETLQDITENVKRSIKVKKKRKVKLGQNIW